MGFFYNFLFTLGLIVASPFYFFKMWRRGNWREGFTQRFGNYDSRLKSAITNRKTLWIHAVSVGEVNIATRLIQALDDRAPYLKLVVSTTTSTGMSLLRKRLPSHVQKIYYPIDRKKFVQWALATVHPEGIVLVEAEIWPNFLTQAQKRNIPVYLVNARLSDKSYRGYRRYAFIFRPLFASLRVVGVQNEADAQRVKELGCRDEAVHVVGNLKFDSVKLEEKPLMPVHQLLRQLGVPDHAQILLGGSTHSGEEAILADIYLKLKPRYPNLFLIVVPRHHERGRDVGRDLESRKLRFAYRTDVTPQTFYQPGTLDALLVNTTGELRYFYDSASVIFVGKSLTAEGGQNPIEPGAIAKPILFGPNMQNFEAITARFLQAGGAIQVKNAAELERAVDEILGDPAKGEALGQKALAVVRENQGSIEKTVDLILANLKNSD